MNPSRYANIVRVGAAYDILATLPFAIPLVAGWCLRAFADLDAWLGLGTAFATLDATSLFFINLGALAYVAWGVARWRQPTASNGQLNAGLRLLVIGLQLFALSQGATPILWGLAAVLLLLAVLELRAPSGAAGGAGERTVFSR
ncbi:hypothetical protein [Pseudomonas fluorescens]|uniref:hypothetical protein n=2 Tax=Pseudomonas TaxID=286 RepID=UPI0020C3208E|nr:hypothetical protein [Pseudomonas fluorescens]UTL91681.1 hypothetical protein NLL86_02750 [Pseudomonas fluorescens]